MIDTFRRASSSSTSVAPSARPSVALDLKVLGFNLVECRACQGRWFALACAVDAVHRFLAPRVITTLVATLALWAAIGALT